MDNNPFDGRNECSIRELSPSLANDYLSFFDKDAFSDNPEWSGCYCYYNQAPHHLKKWEERNAEENRQAVKNLILEGKMTGYLAYYKDMVIGWCHADDKEKMTTLKNIKENEQQLIGSVVCFLVSPLYRGKGVGRKLLMAACEGLKKKGFYIAEAYPREQAIGPAINYHGPLMMYEKAGFIIVNSEKGIITVRKRLGDSFLK
jgi:GNAT superfamily N-acetyltransferase